MVGLGTFLVLTPSIESNLIGYVDNSGRIRSKTCRFTHGAGAGLEAFFEDPIHLSREGRYSKPTGVDARI